jgi:hypothetical protein
MWQGFLRIYSRAIILFAFVASLFSIFYRNCVSIFYHNYAGVARSTGPAGAWLAGPITDLRKQK